jgi:hypothetical protein
MAESTEWRDQKYQSVFEEELRGLYRRFAANPDCPISDIEQQLRHLYIQEGNDQEGRGAVGDVTIAATIAAYERFIHEHKPHLI